MLILNTSVSNTIGATDVVLFISIIIFIGMLFGKLIEYVHLPKITGYLIGGVIIGPSMFGIIPSEAFNYLNIISDIALGFIAFSIGLEINFIELRKTGLQVVIITLSQAILTYVLVFLTMYFLLNQSLSFSLVMGAIATATAPGSIMMVIKQYKAKGPIVSTLLPLVALDDVIGIVMFGISLSFAKLLSTGQIGISFIEMIAEPVVEIVLSLLIGVIGGVILSLIINHKRDFSVDTEEQDQMILVIQIIAVFTGVSLAYNFHASPILLPMIIGTTFANTVSHKQVESSTKIIDFYAVPILIAFFTLAGVELDLESVIEVGVIGIAYIIVRIIGKVLGSRVSAKLAKAPATVQSYLGLCLIPQAGVAIGMAIAAKAVLPTEIGSTIETVALAATLIYAVIGPLLAKIALIKAGEVKINS